MESPQLQALPPVYTASLFSPLHRELVTLLRGLDPQDWERPAVGSWRKRDLAAHLLHGDFRELSSPRRLHDDIGGEKPSFDEVVNLIDADNATGVQFLGRLSPTLLTDLLDVTGRWVAELFAELDPQGVASTPVLGAGEQS